MNSQFEEGFKKEISKSLSQHENLDITHLPSTASKISRLRTRNRKIAAFAIVGLALGPIAISNYNTNEVIADTERRITTYMPYDQSLTAIGSLPYDAGSLELANYFSNDIAGITNASLSKVSEPSNSIADIYAISVDGKEISRVAIVNYGADPRTSDFENQRAFIAGASSILLADGNPVIGEITRSNSSLVDIQESQSIQINVPLWSNCDSIEASLLDLSSPQPKTVSRQIALPGEIVTLKFATSEPRIGFALAKCITDGRVSKLEGSSVGLIPTKTVPKSLNIISGVATFKNESSNSDYGSAGYNLFIRKFTGKILFQEKGLSVKINAGAGHLSPAQRCIQLNNLYPDSESIQGLTESAICGIELQDGFHFVIVEIEPGVVMELTDNSVKNSNKFELEELNQVINSLRYEIKY